MKKFKFQNWKRIAGILFVLGIVFFALSGYMAKAIDVLIKPLIGAETWFGGRIDTLSSLFVSPEQALALQEENNMLKKQIAELQTEVIELQQTVKEADVLYALLGFARGRPEETYIPATVIGTDPSPFLKYVLIDQGSDDGVRYGMPVVTDKGLVGRIEAVTASAARVKLITDSTSMINGTILEAETECVIQGSVTGDVTVEMVSQDANLASGQVIQTSGLGGEYPAGVIVGQILNVKNESGTFLSASIQTAEDFSSLGAVLVVASFQSSDTEPLEY